MNFTGKIKYISQKPLNKKPELFSTNGYWAKTKDGKEIIFDWMDTRTNIKMQNDGRAELIVELINFDETFFTSSNGIKLISAKELTDLELTADLYTCFADQNEEKPIILNLTEFSIYDIEKEKTYDFNIPKKYNKELI